MEATQEQHKQLAYNIVQYLNEYKTQNKQVAEGLEVAVQCICDAFGVDSVSSSKYSISPLNLLSVFALGLSRKEQLEAAAKSSPDNSAKTPATTSSITLTPELEKKFTAYCKLLSEKGYFEGAAVGSSEYNTRLENAKVKFAAKFQKDSTPTTPTQSTPTQSTQSTQSAAIAAMSPEERTKKAEEYKGLGNQKLSASQHQEAIDLYTKAIEYDSNNAIYYANRAAALSHLGQHQKAIEDTDAAIKVNPGYGKAYSRRGLAYFSLGNYEEAITNYKKALEIEPGNATMKQSLDLAEKKLQDKNNKPAGGMPDFSAMLNNPMFQNLAQTMQNSGMGGGANNAGGGGGGAPDLNTFLNNPQLMNMAQNMMSQPGFSDMLNNPAMMNMAQNFMQNPDALNGLLSGMFGGGAGAGAGAGSTNQDAINQ